MSMEGEKVSQLQTAEKVNSRKSQNIQDFTTAVDMENETGGENQKMPMTMTVFCNELIWKTLGRCLNVSDLKCCRLVSRKFNQMVMDETKFKDRVDLKVKRIKLKPQEFGRTGGYWKKIRLTFPVENTSNPANYEWLYVLLKEVEFLGLRLHGNVTASSTTDFHPLLGRLLSSCKKLKSLALEPEFIHLGSGQIMSHGLETLENLEQLEILQPDDRNMIALPPRCECSGEPLRQTVPDFCDKLQNVKAYKSYFPEFYMDPQSLVFIPETRLRRPSMEAVFLYSLCDSVVKNNCEHLQSYPFYDIRRICLSHTNYDTPALLALEVDCFNLEIPTSISKFVSCLNSRPPLEHLDISCPFYDSLNRNSAMLSQLIDSVACHGSSLKKLKLQLSIGNLTDWVFLRDSNLCDLRLVDHRTDAKDNEWIRLVMTNLPNSIEKLYLKGALCERVQKRQKIWTQPLKIEYLARIDPHLVTQLSVFNAGGLLDNQVANFICKNLKMLRILNLSDTLTDDEGFNDIAGLKGLQVLTLKLCGITDRTLKLIRFVELRYLDIAGNLQTTVSRIKTTIKECPSLETLVVPHTSNFTKEDGQRICPRLKLLIQPNDHFPDEQ